MLKYFTYSSDVEDLKSQYRRLARKHHPDLHPDDIGATKRMQDVNTEFSSLMRGKAPNDTIKFSENTTYSESLEKLKKMHPEMLITFALAIALGAVLQDWANKRR